MFIAGCAGLAILVVIVAVVVTRERPAPRTPQDDADEFVVGSKDERKDA